MGYRGLPGQLEMMSGNHESQKYNGESVEVDTFQEKEDPTTEQESLEEMDEQSHGQTQRIS